MIRLILVVSGVCWLVVAGHAQDSSLPQAMPGSGGESPKLQTAPEPPATATAEHHATWTDDGDMMAAADCCPTRLGLLRRLFGGWSRCLPACAVPQGCSGAVCPADGGWCPIITTYDHRRPRMQHERSTACREPRCRMRDTRLGLGLGCRERGSGFGLVLGCRIRERCRVQRGHPLFDRIRAWLAGGRCPGVPHTCMANPYQAPLRYYFNGTIEPEIHCNAGCGGSMCVSGNGASGMYVSANGSGGVYTATGVGGMEFTTGAGVSGVWVDGQGLLSRFGDRRYGSRSGLLGCRSREQCPGLAGSYLDGQFRFARDEKPAVPPINTSQERYGGSWQREMYMKLQQATPPMVQQASHQAPKR